MLHKSSALRLHHMLYWKGRHTDTSDELITVCEKCHTPANHQPGGKLYGMEKKLPRLEGAAYMNIVRWEIINRLEEDLPDVHVHHCYGAKTSRKRKDSGLEKSHINDAYCIGEYMPEQRWPQECYQKKRRNNRILEKFYDAEYIDSRTGKTASGKELGSNRTNRNEKYNSEKSLRMCRANKVKPGHRSIRTKRYPVQPHDIVKYNGKVYSVVGTHNKGATIQLAGSISASARKTTVIRHSDGWVSA